jgi:hypothetical protein
VIEDLVRESGASRELAEAVRSTTEARRQAFHQAMGCGVARGELDPAADHELVIDLQVGPLWTRLLVTDRLMTSGDVEAIVDAVPSGVSPPRRRARWTGARSDPATAGPHPPNTLRLVVYRHEHTPLAKARG